MQGKTAYIRPKVVGPLGLTQAGAMGTGLPLICLTIALPMLRIINFNFGLAIFYFNMILMEDMQCLLIFDILFIPLLKSVKLHI
jgi:hypothetical protein